MKQILQNAKSGSLELVDVPAPAVGRGQVLVKTAYSVMSPGTEKMAMDFARKSLLGKARSRPDLVKQVLRKLQQEGPLPTYRTVMNRLDAPQPLGYACAGVVEEVGAGVTTLSVGDRVACAGAGYANHAEFVVVPENLTAHVPEDVSLDRAAFSTLGAIAMQGLRVGEPSLGEVVVVIGLGLIGQLTVQLLLANGCQVYGVDVDPKRIEQAKAQGMQHGAAPGDDHDPFFARATGGHGADLAVVTAASDSSAPIALAAELCRHRGRIVAVGATAMDLDRRVFYEKELELRMSMSYGPGRYDRRYEEEGLDYPIAYVRWTEQRNLQAFLDLAARGVIDPRKMDVETVPFGEATGTYEALAGGERKSLAAVFEYDADVTRERIRRLGGTAKRASARGDRVGVGFVGAGNYAKAVLLPALQGLSGVDLTSVVTATGPSAMRTGERYGFADCGTDPAQVFENDTVDLVFVTTQHDSHADLAEAALRAGKHVWLEKPVGLREEEVQRVLRAASDSAGLLMVGHNRRFSSHAIGIRDVFANREGPMALQYVVAAGATPGGTWLTDPDVGGGRIVGEASHFVDLANFVIASPLATSEIRPLGRDPESDDSTLLVLGYADGSQATIAYLANTGPDLPKERWEAHADGKSAFCENYRTSQLPNGKKIRGLNQDKGQAAALAAIVSAIREGGASPMRLDEIESAALATLPTTSGSDSSEG